MKKILYFLIGLLLMLVANQLVYAGTECATWECFNTTQLNPSCSQSSYPTYAFSIETVYLEQDGATTVWDTGNYSASSLIGYGYTAFKLATTWVSGSVGVGTPQACDTVGYKGTVPDEFLNPSTDADGDGIPDTYDLYPDDPTPYKFSIMSMIKDDSTGQGVRYLVKTDRGDIFAFGSEPEDMTGYSHEIFINPSLIDGADAEALFATQTKENTTTVDNSALYDTTTDVLTNNQDPGTGTASNMSDGSATTGSETDNEALQKIITNTYSTTENTKRLGDYLKSINDTLSNIDTKQTLEQSGAIGSGGSTLSGDDIQSGVEDALTPGETDVSNSVSAAGNTDSAYSEAQGSITGTASLAADAPDDYKEKTDIAQKIDDLLDGSPFMNLITGTGVSTSGANPSLSYDFKGHPITLTVAGFESELNAFGTILLAITTLAGMLLIFRG